MPVQIKVSGDLTCFTRPEMKVERVSYDVITPSAARGILEAVYWKPQIRWVVDRLRVLRPIRFTNLRRNEVGSKASAANAKKAMNGKLDHLGLYVEEERQQRAATLLRDVAYLIEAHFEYTDLHGNDLSGGDRNDAKHLDQFNRRARRGQHFHQPYLGCREFPADVELIEPGDPPPEMDETAKQELGGKTIDLGYMLYDIAYTPDKQGGVIDSHRHQRLDAHPLFFRASMTDGQIDVARQVAQQGVVR